MIVNPSVTNLFNNNLDTYNRIEIFFINFKRTFIIFKFWCIFSF